MKDAAKWLVGLLFLLLAVDPFPAFGGSVLTEGFIDKDLKYEAFEIKGGFLTGSIVNTSSRPRQGIRLDAWTTNPQETRVYWRKTLNVGDLGPGARYQVRESYTLTDEMPDRVKFLFKLPHRDNYRN